MSLIWRLRLRIARFLLGSGPSGHDYYFSRQVLYTRKQAPPRGNGVGDGRAVVRGKVWHADADVLSPDDWP